MTARSGWPLIVVGALGLSLVLCGVGITTGCGHTKAATDPTADEQKQEEGNKSEKADGPGRAKDTKSKASDEKARDDKARDDETSADRGISRREPDSKGRVGEPPPLAASPAGLLKPGAAEKIQEKLASRGLLNTDKKSGRVDAATQAALRRFQRDVNIPETGAPDTETIRRLGLSPDDIFRAAEH